MLLAIVCSVVSSDRLSAHSVGDIFRKKTGEKRTIGWGTLISFSCCKGKLVKIRNNG